MFDFSPSLPAQEPARVILAGPSGSGRTHSSLRIAEGLAQGGSIGLIDTQRGHSHLYADEFKFEALTLHDFAPHELRNALAVAADRAFDVLIIDNASAFYSGKGGLLGRVDAAKAAGRYGWGEVRPLEQGMLDAFACFDGHLILTMNVKTEWVSAPDETGKPTRVRVGLEPDFKKGAETGFHLVGDLDGARLTVTKSQVREIPPGEVIDQPGEEIGKKLAAALSKGAPVMSWRDHYELAMDEGATYASVTDVQAQVERRGLGGAVFIAPNGEPITLAVALQARAKALMARRPAGNAQ